MDPDVQYQRLMDRAMRFVSLRKRSSKEVQDYLHKALQKPFTESSELASRVLARLTDMGYIDDLEFSRWWVSARRGSKPRGTAYILQELVRKGVDREVVLAVLSERAQDSLSELELAKRALGRVQGRWGALGALERAAKIYRYLASRGFGSEIASKLSRTIDLEE